MKRAPFRGSSLSLLRSRSEVNIAKEKSDKLTDRDNIVQDARKKANLIESEAEVKAKKAQAEADEYVGETLTNLEIALERVLNQVRNGIYILEEDNKFKLDPAQEGSEKK